MTGMFSKFVCAKKKQTRKGMMPHCSDNFDYPMARIVTIYNVKEEALYG